MRNLSAKKQCFIVVGLILATIVMSIIVILQKTTSFESNNLSMKSSQDMVSVTYKEVTDDSVKEINNETGVLGDVCEFVEFNAFFTQDLNNDGVAERVNGACRNINDTAELYFRFTVLSKGYLKDGKIKVNGENFKLDTAIPMDSVIPKTYMEADTKQIDLADTVPNGTQKLLVSKITPRISNVNDYSKQSNTVVFEGTFVYEDEDGNEVEIPLKKTCNLTVDWYGELKAEMAMSNNLTLSNENIFNEETNNVDLTFTIEVREHNNYYEKGLILDSNVVEIKAPEVKGHSAIDAKVTNENVEYTFNKETGILTIVKKSTVDEEGNVINNLPSTNEYSVVLTYPAEIYDNNEKESLVITVPIESYYTGYNNKRAEFKNEIARNIAKSNVVKKDLGLTYENPKSDVYDFRTNIGEYVTSPTRRYLVSKKETIKAYNGDESEEQDLYEVRWSFLRGKDGEVSKAEMGYTQPEDLNEESFNNYTTNLGIYFEGAEAMLGADGYIKVYDADKNGESGLLHIFTTGDWGTYNKENPFLYDEPVKNIRVEVSKSAKSTTLIVHHVKEIDNEKLANAYTKEEFDNKNLLYTYLTGKVYLENSDDTLIRTGVAYYEDEESVAYIDLSKVKIPTTETTENEYISIDIQSGFNKAKWQNGEFVVELPEGITEFYINDVKSLYEDTTIKGYNVEKENGIYLIRIITENAEPVERMSITIDCNIIPDATMPTTTDMVKLYAYNENYNNYSVQEDDIYDANNNGRKNDKVGFSNDQLQMVAPTALITYQTLTDYDDSEDQEITMAPGVAEVNKEQRSAQVNIDVLNNYSSTVTGTKILGKIPYEGNTYVITNGGLGSTFTTELTSKLELTVAQNYKEDFDSKKLEELKSNIKIYYSENETPTNDLVTEANGWIVEADVTDFSKIKSYLVDFGDFSINIGDDIGFKYTISIPEGVDYEKVSYAQHAVYFDLHTPNGLLSDYTEPNKLGVKIVRKYNLNLNKSILGKDVDIANALYLLETGEESEGTYQSYIKLTDENGNIHLNDLYVEKVYKLTELKCEDDYEVSEGSLEFKVVENRETGELGIEIVSEGAGYKTSSVEGNNVNIQVQDKVRYDLNLTKYRAGTTSVVPSADYLITAGAEGTTDYEAYRKTTNDNGIISLDNLRLNKVYTIEEVKANANFAVAPGKLQFTVTQSETDGKLNVEIIEDDAGYKAYTVDDDNEIVKIDVEDDLRYTLKLNKKDANNSENLAGVEYNVKGALIDTNVLTDSDGNLEVSGLKVGERYTVKEVTAKGYYLNDSFDIVVTKNNDGSLTSNIGTIEDNTLSANLAINVTDDKIPTYNLDLIKIEKGNENKTLENVTFTIKGADLNETLVTDENGKISLANLYQYVEEKGEYGIYEIQEEIPAQGYVLTSDILKIRVSKDGNSLKVEALEGESLIADKDNGKNIKVDGDTVTITLQNIPTFKIKKVVEGTETPIPNTKFALYKVTYDEEENESIEPAKDSSGNVIGEEETINGTVYNVIKTNENGEITADLLEGLYCLEEIESAEGYVLPEDANSRKHYFGIGESKTAGGIGFRKIADSNVGNMGMNLSVKETTDGYYTIGATTTDIEVSLADGSTKAISANQHYIIKYDNNANIVWCVNTDDMLHDIQANEDGSCIVMGFGNGNLFFKKYDKNGNITATKNDVFGFRNSVIVAEVSITNNLIKSERGFYIRGDITFENENDIGRITTQDQGEKLINNHDDFIIEYDNEFNILGYYNSSDEDYAQLNQKIEIEILKEKGYVIVGHFENETQIVTKKQGNVTVKNATVLAYDENGMEDWVYSFESNNIQIVTGLKTADGGVVAIGNIMADEVLSINGKEYDLPAGGIFVKFNENGRIDGITGGFEYAIYNTIIDSNKLQDSNGRIVYSGETTDGTQTQFPAYFEIVEYGQLSPEFAEIQEITVENKKLEYKVTTRVVQGEGTISGERENPYEVVSYKEDSTKEIKVVPANGWEIKKITVNGKVVDFTAEGDGSYTLPQFTEMTEDKHVEVWFVNPSEAQSTDYNFEVKKTDEDGNPLANAKFTVKKIVSRDSDGNITETDWARDVDGNVVGYEYKINDEEMFVVESDKDGLIKLNLENGKYKLCEVEAPENYSIENDGNTYFSIGDFGSDQSNEIIEINCIQDLVELAIDVNSNGNDYNGCTIKLMRDLDFMDDDSYTDEENADRSPSETTFGNLNSDYVLEGIKGELTNVEGVGFTPIGEYNNKPFSGVFDGQNFNIYNIYVNTSKKGAGGLFGYTKDAEIKNLGVSGNIKTTNTESEFVGGIVGVARSGSIDNCYNMATVIGNNASSKYSRSEAGGIVGYVIDSISISNCYNSGEIRSKCSGSSSSYSASGGIVGWNSGSVNISNCYNTGKITSISDSSASTYTGSSAGGIVGDGGGEIFNCYNVGELESIANKNNDKYPISSGSKIEKCYYIESLGNSSYAIGLSDEYMMSEEFGEILNENIKSITQDIQLLNWKNNESEYPTLIRNMENRIVSLSIKNNKMKYKITTEILPNSENKRNGGNVSGDNYNDNIKLVEEVKYKQDSTQDIVITPDESYKIEKIIIDGVETEFTPNSDGSYTLPNKFTNVSQDHHIQVIFERAWNFKLNKYDENKNILPGARFTIKKIVEQDGEEIEEDALDINGNIVGSLENIDGQDLYVVTSDENGEIVEYLPEGKYKITEVKAPEGYIIDGKFEKTFYIKEMSGYLYNAKTYSHFGGGSQRVSAVATNDGGYYALNNDELNKYNVNNELEWTKKINDLSEGRLHLERIIEEDNGNLLIGGCYYGKIIISSQNIVDGNEDIVLEAEGNQRPIILEVNKDGNILQVKDFVIDCDSEVIHMKRQRDGSISVLMSTSIQRFGTLAFDDSETEEHEVLTARGSWFWINYTSDLKVRSLNTIGYDIFNNNINNLNINYKDGTWITSFFYRVGTTTVIKNTSIITGPFVGYSGPIKCTRIDEDNTFLVGALAYQNSAEGTVITLSNGETVLYEGATGTVPVPILLKYNDNYELESVKRISTDGYINGNIVEIYDIAELNNGKYIAILATSSNKKYIVLLSENGSVERIFDSNKNVKDITVLTDNIFLAGKYAYAIDPEYNTINLQATNYKSGKVIVHHYLKLPDGTKTEYKVAEDELIEGKLNETYMAFPKKDLDKLELEQENGEYILPSNALGRITEEPQEVIFYYEPKEIKLTINHYYEGTENRIDGIEAEEKTYPSTVVDNGDGTYTITAEGSYDVDTNENYNRIINNYRFTRVTSDITENTGLEDTLTFNKDSVINFYYTEKGYKITTEVIPHTENRTDELTKEKAEISVDGGTITGNYNAEYKEENRIKFVETVKRNKNQSEETTITATPDKYYTVKTIKLISRSEDGQEEEKTLYGENVDENVEITATKNADGSVTLTTFENVTADKHIKVEFEPILSKVIVHHYYEKTGEEYGNEPVEVKNANGENIPNEEMLDYIGEKYTTKPSGEIAQYYTYVESSQRTVGKYEEDEIHVYYYYKYNKYNYTIEHYYENKETGDYEIDDSLTDTKEAEYGEVINITDEDKKLKPEYGYKNQNGAPLTITVDPEDNVIRLYYGLQHIITTDVIEHAEENKETIDAEGNVTKNIVTGVKGGSISGEDEAEYESVLSRHDSTKAIEIKPDEEYEIAKVVIKDGKDAQDGTELDVDSLKDSNGNITLDASKGYFTEMRSDKHVEVEFKKKSKVIVKYLSATETDTEGNPIVLAEEETIEGYESKEFTTLHKPILYYTDSNKGITDENDNNITKYSRVSIGGNGNAEGTMYADTLTVIYWYEKIPAGIVVKHIEINEADKEEGLTLEKGTLLDQSIMSNDVAVTENTNRNVYTKDEDGNETNVKYKDYISVDGPTSSEENLIIVTKDEDDKQAVYKENAVVEVRYYYEKQYKVTTEVKPHNEKDALGNTISVEGGTISGKEDDVYEIINNRGYNSNEIIMTPDSGYRIKKVTIESVSTRYENGEIKETKETRTYTKEELNENPQTHTVTLKAGKDDAYFKDVQANKHIIVEYEKIPAKVIVKYMDKDTKEEIPTAPEKIVNGYVNDDYNEPRIDIDNYIPAEDTEETPEPTEEQYNNKMKEEPIEIIYWYTKQYKVTTEVIPHAESDKDENVELVKGGQITADFTEQKDEEGNIINPPVAYEIINRGESNVKEVAEGSGVAVEIIPDDGYRVKEILVNNSTVYKVDAESESENDSKLIIEGKIIKIPTGYFTNVQENKHIQVIFERIPTVVKVYYLEEGTEKVLYTTEDGQEYVEIKGNVYDEYNTEEKEINNYQLVVEKYPENSKGTMTEDVIIVKYYYKEVPKEDIPKDDEKDNKTDDVPKNDEKDNKTDDVPKNGTTDTTPDDVKEYKEGKKKESRVPESNKNESKSSGVISRSPQTGDIIWISAIIIISATVALAVTVIVKKKK